MPSGEMRDAVRGMFPTGIGVPGVLVAVSMGVTELEPLFTT